MCERKVKGPERTGQSGRNGLGHGERKWQNSREDTYTNYPLCSGCWSELRRETKYLGGESSVRGKRERERKSSSHCWSLGCGKVPNLKWPGSQLLGKKVKFALNLKKNWVSEWELAWSLSSHLAHLWLEWKNCQKKNGRMILKMKSDERSLNKITTCDLLFASLLSSLQFICERAFFFLFFSLLFFFSISLRDKWFLKIKPYSPSVKGRERIKTFLSFTNPK